jgi:hypothetical protein
MEFVVEDSHLDKAYDTLIAAGFPPCNGLRDDPPTEPYYTGILEQDDCYCPVEVIDNLHETNPIPDKHLHVDRRFEWIFLFKKSRFLFNIADLNNPGIGPDGAPDVISVSDKKYLPPPGKMGERYGNGRWDPLYQTVRMPSPYRLREAILLMLRKDRFLGSTDATYWLRAKGRFARYVDGGRPDNFKVFDEGVLASMEKSVAEQADQMGWLEPDDEMVDEDEEMRRFDAAEVALKANLERLQKDALEKIALAKSMEQ